MVFIAKGKLTDWKESMTGGIVRLTAEMHEGFLGSNHKVQLVLDKKFKHDVEKTLEARETLDEADATLGVGSTLKSGAKYLGKKN